MPSRRDGLCFIPCSVSCSCGQSWSVALPSVAGPWGRAVSEQRGLSWLPAAPRGRYPCFELLLFFSSREEAGTGNSLSLLERAAAQLDVEKLSPLNGTCAPSSLARKYLENTVLLAAFHGAEGGHSTARAESWLAGAVQQGTEMEKPLRRRRRGGSLGCLSPGDHEALQAVSGRSAASPGAGNGARTDAWLPQSWYGALSTRRGSRVRRLLVSSLTLFLAN